MNADDRAHDLGPHLERPCDRPLVPDGTARFTSAETPDRPRLSAKPASDPAPMSPREMLHREIAIEAMENYQNGPTRGHLGDSILRALDDLDGPKPGSGRMPIVGRIVVGLLSLAIASFFVLGVGWLIGLFLDLVGPAFSWLP